MSAMLLDRTQRPSRLPVPKDLLHAMGVAFQSAARGMSQEQLLQLHGEDAAATTRVLLGMLQRAAQTPAMTSVPGWAGNLVQPAVQAFLDLVSAEGAVALQLPFARYIFEGKKLRVPMRVPSTTPNLAGAWREEGLPIRIGALSVTAAGLEAKSMGVIGTSTLEMVRAAGDGVMMDIIRQGIAVDSARMLDATVFDDEAADAERPAGLGYYASGDNTAASSGTDAAAISADLKARLDQLVAAGFGGPNTRWVMNTLHAATLAELFTETQTRDTFLRLSIVAGHLVPAGTVWLIDGAGVALGADVPVVDSSGEALLHEEGDADAVSPIATGAAGAGVVATPARSLFQTNAAALRALVPLDWVAVPGSVQTLTGVTW